MLIKQQEGIKIFRFGYLIGAVESFHTMLFLSRESLDFNEQLNSILQNSLKIGEIYNLADHFRISHLIPTTIHLLTKRFDFPHMYHTLDTYYLSPDMYNYLMISVCVGRAQFVHELELMKFSVGMTLNCHSEDSGFILVFDQILMYLKNLNLADSHFSIISELLDQMRLKISQSILMTIDDWINDWINLYDRCKQILFFEGKIGDQLLPRERPGRIYYYTIAVIVSEKIRKIFLILFKLKFQEKIDSLGLGYLEHEWKQLMLEPRNLLNNVKLNLFEIQNEGNSTDRKSVV